MSGRTRAFGVQRAGALVLLFAASPAAAWLPPTPTRTPPRPTPTPFAAYPTPTPWVYLTPTPWLPTATPTPVPSVVQPSMMLAGP